MPRNASDTHWTDPSLLILTSLADQARHGVAIVEDVERRTGVVLGPGTLYGAIARLESRGLIESLEGEGGRRPYRLTEHGVRVLETETRRMQELATSTLHRLARAPAR